MEELCHLPASKISEASEADPESESVPMDSHVKMSTEISMFTAWYKVKHLTCLTFY